jgi:aryl-alcohol dehydrogenase-like predicted oxidoreductase
MNTLPRRLLGTSPIEVPVVGLGCNNFGRRLSAEASSRVVHAALDDGVFFFDTADVYGDGASEEQLGRALRGRRDGAVIATKFGWSMHGSQGPRGSARWIAQAVDDSLRRLDTDRIDLYQHHVPDPETPLEETLGALNDLVVAGKVGAIGCSNYSGEQIEQADSISARNGWARYVTAQNHYSLLERRQVEDSVTPECRRLGLGILPYFPLANGLLTGKYRRGAPPPEGSRLAGNPQRAGELMTESTFDVIEALDSFAHARGITLLDVAIGGLAAQPQVASVIAGATTVGQVRANAAAGRWAPAAADLDEIDRITRRQPVG